MAQKRSEESHPSYGVIGISRITCGPPGTNLFGSSICHGNVIALRIHRATKQRNMKTNWHFASEPLIEVWLSPTQFSDMITSPNIADGVPCTIRYVGEDFQGECPEVNQKQIYQNELKNKVSDIMGEADKLMTQAIKLLDGKGQIKAADRKSLLETIEKLRMEIRSNMPFAAECYNEAMEQTITEAKAEVEAFIQNKITQLGLKGLQQLTGDSEDIKMISYDDTIDGLK